MERMIEVLKLLASQYTVQKSVLPTFVVVADEIALLFDDELRLARARGLVEAAGPEVGGDLAAIDEALDGMGATKALWTDEGLRDSVEWQQIRDRARQALVRLGEPNDAPNMTWIDHVQG